MGLDKSYKLEYEEQSKLTNFILIGDGVLKWQYLTGVNRDPAQKCSEQQI